MRRTLVLLALTAGMCILAGLRANARDGGWDALVTNLFGKQLDPTTMKSPSPSQAVIFGANGKWGAGTAVANDPRLPTPSTVGALIIDTGAVFGETQQGAAHTLLHGTGGSTPTFSQLVDADVTLGTITAGSLASSVTNRMMLTPTTIGRIEVDGGAGNPPVALAQGTSVQFLQSGGAAANPGFVSFSGDFTVAAGGLATLASTISAAGPIGDGTHVPQITFDAKGRLTTVTSVAITASGSTIALQNGGSGVTGSPASTLNATNGLTFGTVSAGVSALAPTYGVIANTFEQGNDTRNNAAPSAAGDLSVDTGSAWHSIAAGATNTLLHGNGAADPTWSSVGTNDLAANAVTAAKASTGTGSTNLTIGNDTRLNAAPSAAGKLSVDTGSAWHSLAAGAANTLLHGAGAADPAYSAVVAGDTDATVTISSGAHGKTGDQDYGNNRLTGAKEVRFQGQSGAPASFAVGGQSYDTTFKGFIDKGDSGVLTRGGVYSVQVADSSAVTAQSLTAFDHLPTAFPANTLTAGRLIRWKAKYVCTTSGSPTFQHAWKLGTTVIADTGTGFAALTSVTNALYESTGQIVIRTTGASGTYESSVFLCDDNLGAFTTSSSPIFGGPTDRFGSPAATIDTTASQQLTDFWNWSGASQTIKRTSLVVEVY